MSIEKKFNLFEEQKKLSEGEISDIYGGSENPEDKFVGVDEDTTDEGNIPELGIDEEDRLLDEAVDRNRSAKRGNTGEKQVKGDFRKLPKEEDSERIQETGDTNRKPENGTRKRDWNDIKEEMYSQLYKKMKEEFEKATDKKAYIEEMKNNIESFSRPSPEDKMFLNRFFGKEDKIDQNEVLRLYKEIGLEVLNEIAEGETNKPETIKTEEEEKTAKIEKLAEELRTRDFENLTVDELKKAMGEIEIYFDEVRITNIKDKDLIARASNVKVELARYNKKIKWMLKNERQKKKDEPQKVEDNVTGKREAETAKPETIKTEEEEKTVEIEKLAEELRTRDFETSTVDELEEITRKIEIYFDEVRIVNINIKDKDLVVRVSSIKVELAGYNKEMKRMLKNERQRKKNEPQKVEDNVTEKNEKEAGIESIDDYFRNCKKDKVKLRVSKGGEKTFIVTSISGKGNVIRLKNTMKGGNIKTSNINKEFLYKFNNVKVNKEDLVNLKETIKENRSLFDDKKLNSFAIEGTIEKFLEGDENVNEIDISDDSAVIRALEIVKRNEKTGMKKHVPNALIVAFERSLEPLESKGEIHMENEGEIRDLEERIEKYKDILNMLKDELESYGDEDFESRDEIEGFIKKLEKLINLMSELLELKKEGNEVKIEVKELEIRDLVAELKNIREEITEGNRLLKGANGREAGKLISDLGWNPDRIPEDEKTSEEDIQKRLEELKVEYRKAEEDNDREKMGYLAEEIRALGIETEIEDEDEDEKTPEEDLQKKLEDLKAEYASAEEDGDEERKKEIMEKIKTLEAEIDDKAKKEDLVRGPAGGPEEGAEPDEPIRFELNEARKESIRKTNEIEKLRKENEDILFIPWEDLTDEQKEIRNRIEELEIGRVLDESSAIFTDHNRSLERRVGTLQRDGILDAQKRWIESETLCNGVEMLKMGLEMKMKKSKEGRKLFPSIEKFSSAIENSLKGKLKSPFKKKERKEAISETNERFGGEKRKDLSSISEQDLVKEFETVLGDIGSLAFASVSSKKNKKIIKEVESINIEKVFDRINNREDIKNDHKDIESFLEESKEKIEKLPNDLSNPREYLGKMIGKVEDIFKGKIVDSGETSDADSGETSDADGGGELLKNLKNDIKKDLGELGTEKLNMLDSLVSLVEGVGRIDNDTDGKELIDRLCGYNNRAEVQEAVSWIKKYKDNNKIKNIRLKDIKEFISDAKKPKEELLKNLKDSIKKDLEELEKEQLDNLKNLISGAEISGQISDSTNINELIDKLQSYGSSPEIKDITDWIEGYKNKGGAEKIKLRDIKKFIDDIK